MALGRLNRVLLYSLLLEPSIAIATHLDPNLQHSCYGTGDTGILSPSGACWDQLFIDGSNTCDVQDSGGTNGADGTDVADIDGDGDLDVVTGWEESGDVFVYLNPGQSSVGTSSWTKVSVAGEVTIANIEDAVFADLDADCTPESVVTAMEGGTDKVCVHEKSGDAADASQWSAACLPQSNKNFMRVQIGQLYPRSVAAADNLPESSCVAEEPPGCNDIVVGAKSDSGEGETLMWYECLGTDKLAPDSWQRHTIGDGVWFMSVWLVDMDGDEDLDVLFSDRARVGWFENPYDSSAAIDPDGLRRIRLTWDRHVIEGPGGLSGEESADPSYGVSGDVRDMAHHDLDGDGDEDIISTVNYDLSECPPNSGATCTGDTGGILGNPGIRIVAHYYERRLVASEPTEGIAFLINRGIHAGKWLQFIRHVVAVDDLPYRDEDLQDGDDPDTWISKAVEVGDVAGDGRPEVVFTARGSGHGVYYLDPVADPNADSTEFLRGGETLDGEIWHVVKVAPAYLNLEGQSEEEDGRKMKYDNLQLVDLDGDRDLDVVTSEENVAPNSRGLGVVWYRNPDANQVPVARCKDVVVGTSGNSCSVTSAPIDDGSFDPDGDTLRAKYDPSGPYFLGITSVELTVTDLGGASASCTASVTLEDDQGPPLVCPSNQIAECQGRTTPVSFDDPLVGADNCSDVSTFTGCVPSSGFGFFLGSTGVACSATDGTNTSGCSFAVTVRDTIAPTVTAPADIVRECTSPSGAPFVLEPAQASDQCDDQPLIAGNAPNVFPPGTTTVSWTARDLSGNESPAVQSAVTVVDTTPPEITCPGDLTLEPTSPAGALVVYPAPDAEDACDANPTVACIPASGSTLGVGTTTMIRCTATDAARNQGLCSFSTRVLSMAEMVTSLRDRVNALAGVLTPDQLKGLNDNLSNLLRSIHRQQKDSACGQVMGFIVKLRGWIGEGILTPPQGQPLIDSATNLSRSLGC